MTLVVSCSMLWCMFILVQSITYNPVKSCTTDRFNNKWFGPNCKYRCHCKNNVACNGSNGDCPNGCDSGWFGPACQYADIVTNGTIKVANNASQSKTKITDGNDTTCASLTGSNAWLTVNWDYDIYFTWLRIIVRNIELQKESLSIKFPDDVTSECSNVFVDNVTMDIYCNVSKPIREILLSGAALGTLCSLYVSQGRNVALLQRTDQTSDYYYNSYKFDSSKAVDGSSSFKDIGCTHTKDDGEDAPTWSLHFNKVVSVTHYKIFNRVYEPDYFYYTSWLLPRLKGFILKTFDQRNNIVQNYTDKETSALALYNVLSTNTSAPVLTVQITATYPGGGNVVQNRSILTLCEVEIYGDSLCSTNKYGRVCENDCNCAVKGEKCFVSTGNCPSGCNAGFYGQGCIKRCDAGYFGVDCRNRCSSCASQHCEAVDGNCTSCAFKGKKLPSCKQECSYSTYGESCKASCSSNCNINSTDERICDSDSGKCLSGCRNGFEGFDCTTSTNQLDNEGDYCKVLGSGVGIGIGVMIAAGFVIGIVLYVWFKRLQKPQPKPRDTADCVYDRTDPTQENENPYFTVDKTGDGYDLMPYFMSFNKTNNPVLK